MTSVRLAIDAYKRLRAGEPEIILKNRFHEKNPVNLVEAIALIIRPALRKRSLIGVGAGRRAYFASGTFTDDLWTVFGSGLFRSHKNFSPLTGAPLADTVTQIGGSVDGADVGSAPDLVARYDVGIGDKLFVADGVTLQWTDGVTALAGIATPDDVAIVSVDNINSYIICVVGSSQRCYWIKPGEVIIDPLNFFEAERSPDFLLQVRTVGDQFWLMGQATTEVWRMTGVAAAPFQRIEGRLFDNGIWGGTAVKIKDEVVVVGNDGVVYRVGGTPESVSNPGITEKIRNAIRDEGLL